MLYALRDIWILRYQEKQSQKSPNDRQRQVNIHKPSHYYHLSVGIISLKHIVSSGRSMVTQDQDILFLNSQVVGLFCSQELEILHESSKGLKLSFCKSLLKKILVGLGVICFLSFQEKQAKGSPQGRQRHENIHKPSQYYHLTDGIIGINKY